MWRRVIEKKGNDKILSGISMINLIDKEVEKGLRNAPHIAGRANVDISLMKTETVV